MTQRVPAPGFVLLSVLIWGGMFSVSHHLYGAGIDAVNMTAIRYLICVAALVILVVAIEGRDKLRYDGMFRQLASLGMFGFVVFPFGTFIGLAHSDPAHAAVVAAMVPLITTFIRWLRDGVRPSMVMFAAVGVALVGASLVVTRGNFGSGWGYGEGLVFLGSVGWAVYTLGGSSHPELSPLRYTALTSLTALPVLVAVAAVADLGGAAQLPSAGVLADQWVGLLYVSFVSVVVAIVSWNTGVRRLGAPNAALFMNFVPIVALGISIAAGYQPVAEEYVGTVLVVAALIGVNLATRDIPARAASVHRRWGRRALAQECLVHAHVFERRLLSERPMPAFGLA